MKSNNDKVKQKRKNNHQKHIEQKNHNILSFFNSLDKNTVDGQMFSNLDSLTSYSQSTNNSNSSNNSQNDLSSVTMSPYVSEDNTISKDELINDQDIIYIKQMDPVKLEDEYILIKTNDIPKKKFSFFNYFF